MWMMATVLDGSSDDDDVDVDERNGGKTDLPSTVGKGESGWWWSKGPTLSQIWASSSDALCHHGCLCPECRVPVGGWFR